MISPLVGSVAFANESIQTQHVVGEAGLGILTETGEIEAGYILARIYWGRGLGTELLRGLLKHGFSKLVANHIVAVCNPDNLASVRIMEKCGMTFVDKVMHNGIQVFKYTTA